MVSVLAIDIFYAALADIGVVDEIAKAAVVVGGAVRVQAGIMQQFLFQHIGKAGGKLVDVLLG